MIPSRVVLKGDASKAERLRAFGHSQLEILLNAMKFQGLEQDSRMVRFNDRSWVRVFSSFGINVITVFAPPVLAPEPIPKEEYMFYAWDPTSDVRTSWQETADIAVLGGVPPFVWKVAEDPICTLANEFTVERENTLTYEGGDASCAHITVFDARGEVVFGTVGVFAQIGYRSYDFDGADCYHGYDLCPSCYRYSNCVIVDDDTHIWTFTSGSSIPSTEAAAIAATWRDPNPAFPDCPLPPCGSPRECAEYFGMGHGDCSVWPFMPDEGWCVVTVQYRVGGCG